MSELKAFDVGLGRYCKDGSPCVVAFAAGRSPRVLNKKVYLKFEADKVIAELKKACNDKDDWCLHTLKEIRHHKYKRCLWLARWCASRSASWCLDPADEQLHKSDFYDKWKLRWLELAKKFKEEK